MINKLRALNESLIKEKQNNPEELKKQSIIKEILKYDDCFFKMDIETAYAILKDLGFPRENIKSIYSTLIDINNYPKTNKEQS